MAFAPEETITTQERLRELIPRQESLRVIQKDLTEINDVAKAFILLSPFAILATKGERGLVSVSPRGDLPGFVEVYDSKTLLLPDRLGNQRVDSFENILRDGAVGLIFVVPGHPETLRVSGTARIVRDSAVQKRLAHKGREPDLTLAIEVEQVFMHCSKAFVRSALWRVETWPERRSAPTLADWVAAAVPGDLSVQDIQSIHDDDARTRLY